MNAAALLTQLRREGVELVADGTSLRFRPAHAVDLERRAALSTHKAEIIELLTAEKSAAAGGPLRAAVVVTAHGESFVIIPDGEPLSRWTSAGVPLNVCEVELLARATGGRPLPPESVRALALAKRHFPGAAVTSARTLPATKERST